MNITNQNAKRAAAALTATALLLAVSWGARPVLAAAPSAPVITTPAQSTSTNPINLTGTADATTTIKVTGGALPASTVAATSGEWSVMVTLTPDSVNNLDVVSENSSMETSATSSVAITHTSSSTPDVIPPAAPTITFPSSDPYATSSMSLVMTGTAEASSTIHVFGGAGTASSTTNGSGDWSAFVSLTASSTNSLEVTATDAAGNVSATTTIDVVQQSSTTTPPAASSTAVITLNGDNPMFVFACNGFTDPGASAVDTSVASTSASSTPTVHSTNNVNTEEEGTYTVVYTATDANGNTATSTRTVNVLACSSGSGGSSGTGDRGSSRTPDNNSSSGATAMVLAGTIISGPSIGSVVGIPSTGGSVLGTSVFRFTFALRMGMSGPEVLELQSRLSETGYFRGPMTGYFGPLTRDALMRLQRANGLAATGELDAQTIFLLNS